MCNIFVEKYNSFSDEDLITLVRDNNQDAFETLFHRYLPLLKSIVSKNVAIKSDFDDLLQDATISFYYAVQMFDFHSASFSTFLSVCVDRSLKSTIRKASAQKRIPEELVVPIDDSPIIINSKSAEEEFFGNRVDSDTSDKIRSKLSELEFCVLKSFLNTGSYDETAKQLNLTRKSVDNALSRIRKKFIQ